MASYLEYAILLAVCVSFADCSLMQQLVKVGERVEITIAQGAPGLARNIDGVRSTVQFNGPNAGVFVDSNGKQLDSSNYEVKADGTLIIKKVTKADIGSYEKDPNEPVEVAENSFVAGPTLNLVLEEEQ